MGQRTLGARGWALRVIALITLSQLFAAVALCVNLGSDPAVALPDSDVEYESARSDDSSDASASSESGALVVAESGKTAEKGASAGHAGFFIFKHPTLYSRTIVPVGGSLTIRWDVLNTSNSNASTWQSVELWFRAAAALGGPASAMWRQIATIDGQSKREFAWVVPALADGEYMLELNADSHRQWSLDTLPLASGPLPCTSAPFRVYNVKAQYAGPPPREFGPRGSARAVCCRLGGLFAAVMIAAVIAA